MQIKKYFIIFLILSFISLNKNLYAISKKEEPLDKECNNETRDQIIKNINSKISENKNTINMEEYLYKELKKLKNNKALKEYQEHLSLLLFDERLSSIKKIHVNDERVLIKWQKSPSYHPKFFRKHNNKDFFKEIDKSLRYLYKNNCPLVKRYRFIHEWLNVVFYPDINDLNVYFNSDPFQLEIENKSKSSFLISLLKSENFTLKVEKSQDLDLEEDISEETVHLRIEVPLPRWKKDYERTYLKILRYFIKYLAQEKQSPFQKNEFGFILYHIIKGFQEDDQAQKLLFQNLSIDEEFWPFMKAYQEKDFFSRNKIKIFFSEENNKIYFLFFLKKEIEDLSLCYQENLSNEQKKQCLYSFLKRIESIKVKKDNNVGYSIFTIHFNEAFKWFKIKDLTDFYLKNIFYHLTEEEINLIPKQSVKIALRKQKAEFNKYEKFIVLSKDEESLTSIDFILEYKIDGPFVVKECLKNIEKYFEYEEERKLCAIKIINEIFKGNQFQFYEDREGDHIKMTFDQKINFFENDSKKKSLLEIFLKDFFIKYNWKENIKSSKMQDIFLNKIAPRNIFSLFLNGKMEIEILAYPEEDDFNKSSFKKDHFFLYRQDDKKRYYPKALLFDPNFMIPKDLKEESLLILRNSIENKIFLENLKKTIKADLDPESSILLKDGKEYNLIEIIEKNKVYHFIFENDYKEKIQYQFNYKAIFPF